MRCRKLSIMLGVHPLDARLFHPSRVDQNCIQTLPSVTPEAVTPPSPNRKLLGPIALDLLNEKLLDELFGICNFDQTTPNPAGEPLVYSGLKTSAKKAFVLLESDIPQIANYRAS